MDPVVVVAIITGLFGTASGALVAYLGAVLKFRKDLEAEYDKDLRTRRIEAYQGLWYLLQYLARYDRPKPLSPRTLRDLTVAMRKWYFEVGGLYLSEESRKEYFRLKDIIQKVVNNTKYRPEDVLDSPDSEIVLKQGKLLRDHLAHDVGTRKSSPIADSLSEY